MKIPAFACFLICVFAVPDSTPAPDQPPTFHSIKLGLSLASQFQECPWNPPKKGDIPQYLSSPYKDERGNTIPCFHYAPYTLGFTPPPAAYTQEVSVELIEHITPLKDDAGNVLARKPFPGAPTVDITLLVPPSAQLGDGTIEEVTLSYDPRESDRVRDALVEKYGTSQPDKKTSSDKMIEKYFEIKIISRDVWKTGWGEPMLLVADKDVHVYAKTQKLISFEQEHRKDEF